MTELRRTVPAEQARLKRATQQMQDADQIAEWIDKEVTDIASAKEALKVLAYAIINPPQRKGRHAAANTP